MKCIIQCPQFYENCFFLNNQNFKYRYLISCNSECAYFMHISMTFSNLFHQLSRSVLRQIPRANVILLQVFSLKIYFFLYSLTKKKEIFLAACISTSISLSNSNSPLLTLKNAITSLQFLNLVFIFASSRYAKHINYYKYLAFYIFII